MALVVGTARADLPPLEQGRDAQDTYELNALAIAHYERTTGWLFKSTDEWWGARRGKRRIAIGHAEFFELVGRDDPASQTRTRDAMTTLLFWGGFAALAVGGIVAITSLDDEQQLTTRGWVGIGVAGAGALALTTSTFIGGPLVDEAEARALANQYNERLRSTLGGSVGPGLVMLSVRGRY